MYALGVIFNTVLAAAGGLQPEEQQSIEYILSWITTAVVVLIGGLLILALLIRQIARRTTHPCRWCMEFISKKAEVCPRCGKMAYKGDGKLETRSTKSETSTNT